MLRQLIPALYFVLVISGATAEAPAWACTSVWSPAGPSTTACASSSCNPRQANLGGNILVLSVGSMEYTHGGFNSAGSNPADCCSKCNSTDMCNSWVFCNRKEGCGSKGSCTAYLKSLGNSSNLPMDSSTMRLPVFSFGTFGPACNQDGTWPYLMCSLKQQADPQKPVVYENGDGGQAQGWLSGVLLNKNKPAGPSCPVGLSLDTCKACAATKAPQKCYSCAEKVQLWRTGAASCVACASLSTAQQQDTCLSCITSFNRQDSCAGCIVWQENNRVNVSATGSCFDCVAAAGPDKRSSSGCAKCYNSYPLPSDMAGCLKCASDSTLSASASYGCASCYGQPAQYRSGCMSCLEQFNNQGAATSAAANCGGCAQQHVQSNKDVGQQCYQCVGKASASTGMYCSMMDHPLPSDVVAVMPKYYKCLAQPDSVTGSGSGCQSCISSYLPAANRGNCFSCISAVSGSNGGTWCSSCWGPTSKKPDACQACLLKAGSNDGYKCIEQP